MNIRDKQQDEYIKVIAALGETPKFLSIPQDLIIPWAIIAGGTFFVFNVLFGLSLEWFLAISIWLCGAWWVLTGSKSYQFTDRLFPLPGKEYININTLFVDATDVVRFRRKMKHKTRSQTRKTRGGKKERVVPFQIESDLHSIMQIEIGADNFSVLLRCDHENNWSASIPFALEGVHPELYPEEISDQVESLSEALKDIPMGESLTMMLGCRSHYRQRQEQLHIFSDLNQANNKLPLVDVLLASEELRVKDLTQLGFRQEWSQYAFVTWTRNKQALRKQNDLLGRTMNWLGNMIDSGAKKLTDTDSMHQRNIYIQLAKEIYENSYYPWKITLGTKAGLSFRNLNPSEIWADLLWYRFNQGSPPPVPQLVTVTQKRNDFDFQVIVNNPHHPKDIVSVLIEGEQGRSTCPQHYSRRDLVAANGEVIATMSLEKPPSGWPNQKEQLRWIWQKLSDTNVKDTEVWLEISNGDKELAHDNLVKLSKQSTASNFYAVQEGAAMDVGATLKQEESLLAQERLHQGAQPLFVALTMLVFRDHPQNLERACNRLSNSFGNAKLIRERQVCWKLWTETFPFNSQRQLKSTALFTERRPTLDSTSAIGLLPITKPKNLNSDGLELIHREGGYPLHIDLFKHNERAIITGKSGSGKSVLSFGIIKQALAQGIRVVGMDMSNAGESTFELITNLLGDQGAYINIIEHSFNLLQPPDLRRFEAKKRADRLRIWQNFTRKVIVSLAMGNIQNPELLERVDSIILRLLDIFFKDEVITQRYNKAFDRGWKSVEWQNMPTLEDLLFFCSKEKLGLYDFGGIDERAINQINNQVGAKLIDPNIGDAIGKPSNISPEPVMQFFALSGLSNENNAYIMALVAQMACLNAALQHPKSLFVMDECSVLLAKRGFSEVVGERFATGRKEGQSVLVIGQDIEAILNCPNSSQIMTNTDIMLIGKTTSDSAQTYSQKLKIPPYIINKNAAENYRANRQYLYSHWLVSRDNRFWDCLYFPSIFELAALANSSDEKAARNRILQKYSDTPKDLLMATGEFACLFYKASISGISITDIYQKQKDEKTNPQIAA
ncbi:MAG: hypothetical protein QNJ53_17765 [Pleurocapsa sp. MO_192.B19]|nr:hypothetical protein [Pleurocapsa sp. MO_192.B19]